MAKSSTTINKENRDNMPGRGRSNKTLILEVFRENTHLGLTSKSTKEEAEKAFFSHIATSAFILDDPNRSMCLKLLSDKGWANIKPSSEMLSFNFDENAKPHEQASQVMKAVSIGEVPPDMGLAFISGIAGSLKIQEVTDIDERLKTIEELAKNGE